MAVDLFAKEDGIVGLSGIISFEVDTTTVVVGDVVYAKTHVAQGLPKVEVVADDKVPIGVVCDLGKGGGIAGTIVSVAMCGSGYICKIVASGVINVGTLCKTAADGEAQAMAGAASDTEEHQHVIGVALQTTATDQDEFLVLLT